MHRGHCFGSSLVRAGALGLVGLRLLLPRLMRHGSSRRLTPEAAAFAKKCFAGIDRSRVWDAHVHLIGLGAGGTGCSIDPEMLSHLHPIKRFQFDMYKAGAGITDPATADADYVDLADDPTAAEREAIEEAPLKRVATPEEIAKAIAYLASHDARFITGVALPMDGGISAGY